MLLAQEGFIACRGECRCSVPRISRDLWNFADVIGLKVHSDNHIRACLVQVTSRSNVSARRKKIDQLNPFNHDEIYVEVWGYDGKDLKRRGRLVDGEWIKLI